MPVPQQSYGPTLSTTHARVCGQDNGVRGRPLGWSVEQIKGQLVVSHKACGLLRSWHHVVAPLQGRPSFLPSAAHPSSHGSPIQQADSHIGLPSASPRGSYIPQAGSAPTSPRSTPSYPAPPRPTPPYPAPPYLHHHSPPCSTHCTLGPLAPAAAPGEELPPSWSR